MPDGSLPSTARGDVVRRLVKFLSSATRLADVAAALQAAASAVRPADTLRLGFAGAGTVGFGTQSMPKTFNRWEPTPSLPRSSPVFAFAIQRSGSRLPIRTGELFSGAPAPTGETAIGPAEDTKASGGGDDQIGSVTIQSFRVPAHAATDASLLSLLAEQTSPAVERVSQLVRSPAPDPSYNLLSAVQCAIGESAPINTMFQRITETISTTFDVGCALAVTGNDDRPTVCARHSVNEFASATADWLAEILCDREISRLLKTQLNPIGHDQAEPDLISDTHRRLASAPVRAVQLFPLPSSGRWVGALLLFDNIPLKLDAAAHDTITRAVHQIGLATGEKFLSEGSPLDPDRRRGWARLMTALLAAEPRATVLRDVLVIGGEVIQVDGALIRLHGDEIPPSEQCVAVGDTGFEKLVRAVIQQRAIDTLLREEPSVAAKPDTPGDRSGPSRLLRAYPVRLVLPIQSGESQLGELCLFRANAQPFNQDEIEDARQFARVMAVTLQQRNVIQARTRQDQILATVRDLAERLNRATNQQSMAEIAVEVCAAAFGSGKASLHLFQEQSERLVMAAAYGLPIPFVTANTHLPLGKSACGRAAQLRSLVVIEDVSAAPDWASEWHASDKGLDVRAVWSLPLIASGDTLLGTLAIYHAHAGSALEDNVSLLRLLGHQVAAALDRARLADRSQDLYRATVQSLAAAVDAKDPFTHNHSWQVSAYCRKIAETLGLPGPDTEIIELAGLLHDVGKIGIPDRVLQKPDELAPDEWAMMQRHPDLGARILGDNQALAAVVPLVRHHHERFDGRGYPDQLSGNDIPLGAAIVGLADAFDTMTSDRPYRRARTIDQALQEVTRCSGSHFHPKVVSAFLQAVKSGRIAPLTNTVPPSTTRELRLKRVVGSEARGFGLLQRITTEIGALVDLDRFLQRLNELMSAEFPESICEIFGQDPNTGDLIAIANSHRRTAIVIPRGQGVAGWVASHGVSQNVLDVLEDARYFATGHRLMRSVIAVPLVVDGHCAGVLSLEHPDPMAYSPSDQHVLEIVATYVAQAIQVANLHDRLKQNANCDPLTGLLNHREFCQRLEAEIDRARMTAGKLAIAILDVRELRSVNRSHGHAAGDDVLLTIAGVLKRKVRTGDTLARYGGDEFALLVPRVSGSVIRPRVATISDALAEIRNERPLPGISWGIASFPADGTRAAEIIATAESALRGPSTRD